ncbi:MAG: alanine--tRNA ligase [Bacteroidetes bacterium]|nr:alanine--tRNA ligase [Bacteroidota bacterium]
MTSTEIRKTFLAFFGSKGHQIVASSPMVVKNDPTLMFINSGMAPFKDIFLGNQPIKYPRVADTQKCLRVSGKHNDLEEVGIDTYHHTMFEMLGNWSFGDYFKKDAIAWSWELLTEVYKLQKDRLYVTVFEGDEKEKLKFDQDSFDFWKQHIAEERILRGNKKDNFWEMGEQGPCGPCSEIHVDLRSEEERKKADGKNLVNAGHPQVVEIWNNVFMEFNRKADGSLEPLPARHVDTGMGFERLCMALQGKTSNYDTDVFQPLIQFISSRCGIKYGVDEKSDIAMRVMSDHIRAITCAIADGQLPSNNKAGYVIRRILRRAVRYGFTFLNLKEPFLNKLIPILAEQFKDVFPEIKSQQDFIMRVVTEEENAFLRTLEVGIKKFEDLKANNVSGEFAFELYDTFGFPIDLTQLMAREKGMDVDMEGFNKCLSEQKNRSRAAAQVDTEDWISLTPALSPVRTDVHPGGEGEGAAATAFVGYDELESDCEILKYRKVKAKGKEQFQLVLSRTPFYAESGGQVGDTGYIEAAVSSSSQQPEKIYITDTQKENNLIIHFADKLPKDLNATFHAVVKRDRRKLITSNHSATHLMHSALKRVLGAHVNQKGSLVNDEHTRFDFSHFAKVSDEELQKIEKMVNEKISENILLDEKRNVPIKQAQEMGATALFGEKYGDFVRVIVFDPQYSMELCGGTHVRSTGEIEKFKIISESSVAAGVRRVEAITGILVDQYNEEQNKKQAAAENALRDKIELMKAKARNLYSGIEGKSVIDLEKEVDLKAPLQQQEDTLSKLIDNLTGEIAQNVKTGLLKKVTGINGVNLIAEQIQLGNADAIKNISFELKNQLENLVCVLGATIDGKAYLSVIISENLVKDKNFNASNMIREGAKEIQGGGGGQPFYATAGGKNPAGIPAALEKIRSLLK